MKRKFGIIALIAAVVVGIVLAAKSKWVQEKIVSKLGK